MFEKRNMIISEIFSSINSRKLDDIEEKIKELNADYDITNFNEKEIVSLMVMFDFPIDKEIVICFHEDSVVLSYDSGYFHEGKPVQGERMFFYHDFTGMRYLKLLLLYINTKTGKCSSCASNP